MSEHEQTADILDGAADKVEVAWFQGSPYRCEDDRTQAVCAMTALSASGRDLDLDWYPASKALMARLGVDDPYDVVDWNNAPERTKQEVLDALRLAAKDQRRLADGLDA